MDQQEQHDVGEAAGQPLLRLDHVSSGYGRVLALRDVSVQVRQGEIVALVGANGAGKSTLLMTVAGLIRPSAGKVTFSGEEIQSLPPEEVVRRGIATSPEGRRVFAHLTVRENLRLGATIRRDTDRIDEDLHAMYDMFPVLEARHSQLAGTLSGGEQQMLALARSLMSRPSMLLLDEPSLGLAPRVVASIYEFIARLPERNVTVLLVEQNVTLALGVAARAYVLRSGQVVLEGPASQIEQTVNLERAYLGDAV